MRLAAPAQTHIASDRGAKGGSKTHDVRSRTWANGATAAMVQPCGAVEGVCLSPLPLQTSSRSSDGNAPHLWQCTCRLDQRSFVSHESWRQCQDLSEQSLTSLRHSHYHRRQEF